MEKDLGEHLLKLYHTERGESYRVKQLTHGSHCGVCRSWGTDTTLSKLGGRVETERVPSMLLKLVSR